MTERNFMQLIKVGQGKGKFVCLGLDSDFEQIPRASVLKHVGQGEFDNLAMVQYWFNKAIIDATRDIVLCYKLNLAFYLSMGAAGIEALVNTILYINETVSEVPVILDAKFGDIGATMEQYAKFAFDVCRADAVTANPYLGREAVKPLLDRKSKGIIFIVKTSNPGSGEFQDARVIVTEPESTAMPLSHFVATRIATSWNENGNCAVVVGATYPEELCAIGKVIGDMQILIPGIGKQGGSLEGAVRNGLNEKTFDGIIVNSSSGIIFASKGDDFAEAARRETQKLHDDITVIVEKLKVERKSLETAPRH